MAKRTTHTPASEARVARVTVRGDGRRTSWPPSSASTRPRPPPGRSGPWPGPRRCSPTGPNPPAAARCRRIAPNGPPGPDGRLGRPVPPEEVGCPASPTVGDPERPSQPRRRGRPPVEDPPEPLHHGAGGVGGRRRRHLPRSLGIEPTFQECRSCLGVETTRGRCRNTVVRAAPCPLGLYSVVAVIRHLLPEAKRSGRVAWAGKGPVTFPGARTAVRRRVWLDGVSPQVKADGAVAALPANVRELLLSGPAPAP